jgi:hypothetical protein
VRRARRGGRGAARVERVEGDAVLVEGVEERPLAGEAEEGGEVRVDL